MHIKCYWVFLHGGIEWIWQGRYFPKAGTAHGNDLAASPRERKERITVAVSGDRITIAGGSFPEPQIGRVWQRSEDLLEVEFFAGS